MIFLGIFSKKRQKYAAHAAMEENSEENTGTAEIGVFRTNEIGADTR